ncbi:trap transporter solute receptor, unknown substrate 1 [hydrocarbon metagenome]|uniref:TRAP transporter solute receptor, TAXI family n=1 Tax=hydrocarbon metagenome TaxID=938273 RepID=A0A0W8E2Z5_9ZZZZ
MYRFAKKGLVLLLVLSLMATLMIGCEKEAEEPAPDQGKVETVFINIGTGGTAGTYYPLGGAMAEILKANIPGANATAESTGASAANINMLNQGELDIALVQNDVSYYADLGIELFQEPGKIEGLKALATLYPEVCQIITTKNTGITSVADFAGKKIAVGAAGSGVEANARQILTAYGFSYEDIKPQYLSFAEAAAGLKDGNIDAAFITAGTPTSAVLDLSAQNEVVLLPIDAVVADKLVEEFPFYTKVTITADVYGLAADVDTLAVKAMLVATDKMSEDMAYNITKAIYENLDKLGAAHSAGKLISLETAQDGISIPLHPGAEKFFNEQ